MKDKLKDVLKFRTVYSKLLASFLIIILIMSAFFYISHKIFNYYMFDKIISNINDRFDFTVSQVDQQLDDMNSSFSQLSNKPSMYQVVNGIKVSDSNQITLVNEIRSSIFYENNNNFSPYVSIVYLETPPQNDILISSSGTYRRDGFYSTHYSNPDYNDKFWLTELQKKNVFTVYKEEEFYSSNNSSNTKHILSPVAYKPPGNNNFMVVALVDFESMISNIPSAHNQNVIISDKNNNIVYPANPGFSIGNIDKSKQADYYKTTGGYLLSNENANEGYNYYQFVSNSQIDNEMPGYNLLFYILFILALLISLGFVLVIVKNFNRPFKQIVESISENGVIGKNSGELETISYVKEGIKTLITKNEDYIDNISQKDSLLQEVFLQSRMRDIYVSLEDVENKININQGFMLLFIRVNFKDKAQSLFAEEYGKATFFLKLLIELYLSDYGLESVTFQVENDQLVSVINVDRGFGASEGILENIKSKLENESEYVFFTIVASKIYNNMSKIKNVYDKVLDLSKYARPVTETQLIIEGEYKQGIGRFYFTVEQMEKFSALLQKDTLENCLLYFNEILDYNIKKDINGFDLLLLCTEVVNCGVKLINRLFHTTPQIFNISNIYIQLDKAVTLEQYKNICESFIEKVVTFIKSNKRDDDYIIKYILDYVENHYSEDIYLNLFSEKLKLTSAYISSYFKEKMNINLSDYINNYRIKKAVALIENPQNKNKDVASMVGLPNINTFIRLFKKYTGYTPGEYRKKNYDDE